MEKRRMSVVSAYWTISYAVVQYVLVIVASVAGAMTWHWFFGLALSEGVILGLMQGWLLRDLAPRFTFKWTVATIVGVFANRLIEFCALLSPFVSLLPAQPSALHVLSDALIGFVMGAALGAVQAIPLRKHAPHPVRWVAVCGVAYAVALPALYLAGVLADMVAQTITLRSAAIVFGLFAAAFLLTGAIEGYGLAWTLQPHGRSQVT
jgi:hypothetical protein